jgi:RNA polymerase sigma-70 factor (ECF subfamily)
MQDLAIERIAAVTGYPEGTVKSHLSRGKEKLANYLKQNGYDGNGR